MLTIACWLAAHAVLSWGILAAPRGRWWLDTAILVSALLLLATGNYLALT